MLAAIECKCPGHFKEHEDEILDRDFNQDEDWKTDVLKFKEDELSFALGKVS